MIRYLLPLLLLGAPLSIASLEGTHESGAVYRFPRVAGDSPAASRINTYLQVLELGKLPGHHGASPFEDVWPTADSPHGVTEMDYRSAFEPPGVLAIEITGFYYGAYESPIGGSYHFDARTGELVTLAGLFSAAGLVTLDEQITRARLARVDDFLAGKPLADGTVLRSDPAEAEEQRELYRECRARIERSRPSAADRFSLSSGRLVLVAEPCAPRALLALDEVDLAESRSFESIATLLGDYGRCLLIERRSDCPRSYTSILPGVYRGQIAERYAITLVVESSEPDGRVRARYFYDKHGKPIDLSGATAGDGTVGLDERGPPPARFELRMQPDGLVSGTWTQQGKPARAVQLR